MFLRKTPAVKKMEKSNYCRLAVNITATNRLNYCTHARTHVRVFYAHVLQTAALERPAGDPPRHFTREIKGAALKGSKFFFNLIGFFFCP